MAFAKSQKGAGRDYFGGSPRLRSNYVVRDWAMGIAGQAGGVRVHPSLLNHDVVGFRGWQKENSCATWQKAPLERPPTELPARVVASMRVGRAGPPDLTACDCDEQTGMIVSFPSFYF